jgi:hypothetical protein
VGVFRLIFSASHVDSSPVVSRCILVGSEEHVVGLVGVDVEVVDIEWLDGHFVILQAAGHGKRRT